MQSTVFKISGRGFHDHERAVPLAQGCMALVVGIPQVENHRKIFPVRHRRLDGQFDGERLRGRRSVIIGIGYSQFAEIDSIGLREPRSGIMEPETIGFEACGEHDKADNNGNGG